jgi:pSer/pThr/pTyr-binding forkhead associated (FHA) protein
MPAQGATTGRLLDWQVMSFGRLILTPPKGPHQEFSLSKSSITIGRSTTADIVLMDSKTSRNHVRLDCSEDGCTAVDLGSANGTQVNGAKIARATLKPGDVILIGGSTLRFEPSADADYEMTRVETEQELETVLLQEALEVVVEETAAASVTVHVPGRTWDVPLSSEELTIGRDFRHPIWIDSDKVSRNHARIERRGDSFVIRDLGSRNGTWCGDKAITEYTLRQGDTIGIGPAWLTFKGAFAQEELTVVETLTGSDWSRRPIVFIPGFGGSNLWRGNEKVWPNVRRLFLDLDMFRITEKNHEALEARGLVDDVVVIPNLLKLDQYGKLIEYLEEAFGYESGNDLMEFAYDFRHDVRHAAKQLAAALDGWRVKPPITLICHSLGCLVARYYVERLGGKAKVGRLILMGGPNSGVPKAALALLQGPHSLPFGLLDDKLRNTLSTFISTYQTLPTVECLTDQAGRTIHALDDDSWLPAAQRRLLHAAKEFRTELGTRSSVPTVCIFGYGIKTITKVQLERDAQGLVRKADACVEPAGDSTIPEFSPLVEGAEIHPVRQYHGALFSDSDVKMRLKLELTR